jgi:hypothetical protein
MTGCFPRARSSRFRRRCFDKRGSSSCAGRGRRCSAISACPAGASKSARQCPRSPGNSWKKLASRPRSSPSTGMSRRSSPRGPGARAFRHRLVRGPLDPRGTAVERRSRRRRVNRSRRRLTLAVDAGARGTAYERGADRRSDRYRRKMTVDIQPDVAKGRIQAHRDAMARMRK